VRTARPPLARRLLAELIGTGMLVMLVVGSGIAAARLSPTDRGLPLLENSTTTALGLAVLILLFAPVSGAHLNPVVTLADRFLDRRSAHRLPLADVVAYLLAQVLGAIGGAALANAMFDLAPVQIATTGRGSAGIWLGEIVATSGPVALIFTLARTGRAAWSAAAVGAYIGAAYWFTSSTSFANPAVTIGRIFSDTFAGIAPGSMPPFVLAQLVGATLGVALVLFLHPKTARRTRRRIRSERGMTTPRQPDPDASVSTSVPEVLFVCVHNAGRSQMAAALLATTPRTGSRSPQRGPPRPKRSTRLSASSWPNWASNSPTPSPRR
jgi:glycerol uptake facilitator-like aquaporin